MLLLLGFRRRSTPWIVAAQGALEALERAFQGNRITRRQRDKTRAAIMALMRWRE